MITNHQIPVNAQHLQAIIGIVQVSQFISPIVGIPDTGNKTPHSYLFLPPRQEWPNFFVKRMKELLTKSSSNENNEDDEDSEDKNKDDEDEDNKDNEDDEDDKDNEDNKDNKDNKDDEDE